MLRMAPMNCDHGRMELQQMRYVIAIAEEQSFTRAAERCFVVQSALSHQVKSLERELGAPLFARTSRRVELTAAGTAFLAEARASVEAAERAAIVAAAASGRVIGDLTIGVIPTTAAVDLPATLRAFRSAHPEVRIRLRGGSSDEFMSAIVSGTMDVAVLGLPDGVAPQRVASRELSRERLVAVLGSEHPLAHRRRIAIADLADDTFADFPEGTPGRTQSDLAFAAAGIPREVMFEAMSTDLILGLIRQNLAIAFLSAAIVPDDPALRTVRVVGGPARAEHLAWSAFNPSPAAQAFLELLEQDA